ncbi:hypothetical protein [Sulfurovum sp.]|uniref:hypothetical protein n=1 Tax=Sulfurovum sp. TaxID=1969726 RepID=UPI0025EA2720|nr:hypothetical protein [Sulfurovum sp.]
MPVKSEALGSSVEKTESKTKTTTILGTYSWDVETDTLGSTSKSDFWWERIDTTKGNLVAQNGTTVEVTAKDFASIDKKYIQQFPVLRYGRINYSDIKPGTVVMFKTGEGHYGKLRIKGYRALHDFDFKEAREYLEASWKNFVMHKQDIKSYHLIVEYTLFK